MPVYNAASYLKQAIDSILNQSHHHLELLICDDASTDDSVAVIQSFDDRRIKLSYNDKNLGYLKTCNQLFQQAAGDIITFQDADDWSELNRLETIVSTFKKMPWASFSLSYYNRVNQKGQLIEKKDTSFDTKAFGHDKDYWEYFCGASIAIRREVLEKVGGYKEYFDRLGGEDYDWLFRIANQFEGVQVSQTLYNYRLHNSSVKQTNNWKSYYVLDLVKAGRNLMLEEEKDYLAPENRHWLEAKVKELETPFEKDKSHLLKIHSISKLNSGQAKDAIALSIRAFVNEPLSFGNLFFPVKMGYWALRRTIKL